MRWNSALQRAVEVAQVTRRPLLVVETLAWGAPWCGRGVRSFIVDGMRANERAFARSAACYVPYVEPARGAAAGLARALAREAVAVVADDVPPGLAHRAVALGADDIAAAAVGVEHVDGRGLLPVRAAGRAFTRAVDFRRHVQRALPAALADPPARNPLSRIDLPRLATLPETVVRRWPDFARAAQGTPVGRDGVDLPRGQLRGGADAGRRRLTTFLRDGLARYGDRGDPLARTHSGLSAYLHAGHVSTHEALSAVARRERWTPASLGDQQNGARTGWWGMSAQAEAFLDELITWRELALNTAAHLPAYDTYDALPEWALATLRAHAADAREHHYPPDAFEAAATHDEVWNAVQRELVRTGTVHPYLRMLWGKKILEWSASPREAFATMVDLNNRYALDGADPSSYAGIAWVLGRYDRPWAPERPVFGTVRYMSSEQTRRKFRLDRYLRRFAAAPRQASAERPG